MLSGIKVYNVKDFIRKTETGNIDPSHPHNFKIPLPPIPTLTIPIAVTIFLIGFEIFQSHRCL
jgi:hypothetical protein